MRRQAIDLEKTVSKDTSDKGQLSKILKKLLELSSDDSIPNDRVIKYVSLRHGWYISWYICPNHRLYDTVTLMSAVDSE